MDALALIGLGSNLGDRRSALDAAVAALGATPGIKSRAVSSYHETRPIGGPSGQGAYLNAAALVETDLDPGNLLGVLHGIEREMGRVRAARWGERTLDLDLLLYGDRVIRTCATSNRAIVGHTPQLWVPHPRFAVRRFVLAPAVEIAPDLVDPITGRSIAQLLANLDRRPSMIAIHAGLRDSLTDPDFDDRVVEQLAEKLGAESIRSPGVELAPGDPSRTPAEAMDEWLQSRVRELDRKRWTAASLGERWLVCGYWFDALASPSRFEPAAILAAHRQIVEPTFVVALGAPGTSSWTSSVPTRTRPFPGSGGVPVLDVESRTLAQVVQEAAITCAATRS
jgi:2-amino-4-hydroxy-6-hydroxymethyldihydropteridine diphosphokinase